MSATTNRFEELGGLFKELSLPEQDALLKALKKQVLLAKAERLQQSVKSNEINMQQVVKEVRKVRQQRYAI